MTAKSIVRRFIPNWPLIIQLKIVKNHQVSDLSLGYMVTVPKVSICYQKYGVRQPTSDSIAVTSS